MRLRAASEAKAVDKLWRILVAYAEESGKRTHPAPKVKKTEKEPKESVAEAA